MEYVSSLADLRSYVDRHIPLVNTEHLMSRKEGTPSVFIIEHRADDIHYFTNVQKPLVVIPHDVQHYSYSFVFDERETMSPHQEALEKRSDVKHRYNGFLSGCVASDDIALAEKFLQHRRNIISYRSDTTREFDDMFYTGSRYASAAYIEAIRDPKRLDFIRLFFKYGYRIPEDALTIWYYSRNFDQESLDMLKLILEKGEKSQITRGFVNNIIRCGVYHFEEKEDAALIAKMIQIHAEMVKVSTAALVSRVVDIINIMEQSYY